MPRDAMTFFDGRISYTLVSQRTMRAEAKRFAPLKVVPDIFAGSNLRRWLWSSPMALAQFRDFMRRVSSGVTANYDDYRFGQLARGVFEFDAPFRLVVLEEERERLPLGYPPARDVAPLPAPSAPQEAWVGIEVVDPEGQPLAHHEVELVLPDGSTCKLSTDSAGRLRMDPVQREDGHLARWRNQHVEPA